MTAITRKYRRVNVDTVAARQHPESSPSFYAQLMQQPPLSANEAAAFRKELGR